MLSYKQKVPVHKSQMFKNEYRKIFKIGSSF